MNCFTCHTIDKFTTVPGVTRWAEVYACQNCGTLRLEIKDAQRTDTKPEEGES